MIKYINEIETYFLPLYNAIVVQQTQRVHVRRTQTAVQFL